MASTFSDLGIELMSTGENAGTWGDKTNTNLQIVEKAIAGYVEKSIAGGAQTTALSITDGTTTESDSIARHAVIKLTGSITGNQIVTVPDSIEKVYIITNGTSGAYTVQFKTASGTGITFGVSEKTTRLVYSDGTNLVDAGFGGALDIEGRELVLDADGDTSLTADTDDQIDIKIGGTDQIKLVDGAIVPVTDNDIDLGTSSLEFKDAFFDGTVTSDAFAGPLTGNVTGNVSGTAATVTTAAQSNITSLGTLTTLTVDNVIINGSTIGHTGDTDLITVASGIATVAGEVSMTTLDIGGTNVTSTAAELNILDGVTSTAAELNLLDGKDATFLAVPGKLEGTNFTDSLLIGHSTTGTLSSAERNTTVGIDSMPVQTTGDDNTALGYNTLNRSTGGIANTAIGSNALKYNVGGQQNVAVGMNALDNANNSYNVAVGVRALTDATGGYNTALGNRSGNLISSGNYNTTLGHKSGDNITSGSGNVVIGDVDVASATGDRQLKIAGYDGSTTTTWISGDNSGNLTFAGTINSGAITSSGTITGFNLDLTDSANIRFGNDDEIKLIHVADTGLILKHTATADDKPISFTLQTGETDIAANDVIGKIDFQAPDEATGTDAILVAAGIEAVSEGDFSSSSNATKLSFKTGASEAAAEKMSLSSDGTLTVSHDVILANDSFVQFGDAGEKIIGDGTNLEIDSSGNLTLDADGGINLDSDSNAINFKDGGSKYLVISKSSSSAVLSCDASDGDIIIKGDDGGSAITAATFDMSDAGTLVLNHDLFLSTADARMGIGTTSPGRSLEISAAIPVIRMTDTDASAGYMEMGNGGSEFKFDLDRDNALDSSILTFKVDGTYVMKFRDGASEFADGSASNPSITNIGNINTGLFFSAANTMAFSSGGTSQFTMADGAIAPVTDNDVDLGTSSLEFKDGYFDGTLHCDVIDLNGVEHTTIEDPTALAIALG